MKKMKKILRKQHLDLGSNTAFYITFFSVKIKDSLVTNDYSNSHCPSSNWFWVFFQDIIFLLVTWKKELYPL